MDRTTQQNVASAGATSRARPQNSNHANANEARQAPLARDRVLDGARLWSRVRSDVLALLVFLTLVALTMWHRSTYDNWLIDFDILTFFLPWYGVLGDRLRDFDIPGWTRHFSAGTPLAGDPAAGWMYAPVMLAFTVATGAAAFKLLIAIQMLIGGVSLYALGRCLGLQPPAALLSTVAFVRAVSLRPDIVHDRRRPRRDLDSGRHARSRARCVSVAGTPVPPGGRLRGSRSRRWRLPGLGRGWSTESS